MSMSDCWPPVSIHRAFPSASGSPKGYLFLCKFWFVSCSAFLICFIC
jgi:hypothetical protein